MEQRTFSELIEDITEVLGNYDVDGLAEIAREVLYKDVEYTGDSLFTVKDK
tara:strand:+ start:41264 stop:41416 length:153 start_codon:yes stop_codon:yes gene_type:complete